MSFINTSFGVELHASDQYLTIKKKLRNVMELLILSYLDWVDTAHQTKCGRLLLAYRIQLWDIIKCQLLN